MNYQRTEGLKMRMFPNKFSKIFAATTILCLSTHFSIAQAADYDDFARVINVTPQVEQINVPRQECRTVYDTTPQYPQREYRRNSERSTGGALVGGIAGGLLGSQVGGGNGKIAAAAVGALTGAIIGDRIDNEAVDGRYDAGAQYDSRPARQCRTIDSWETRTNGYAVTYEYHNRSYTSIMPYDPGNRIRLHVSLTPRP
jgi:uncharacterized protein YcfJ